MSDRPELPTLPGTLDAWLHTLELRRPECMMLPGLDRARVVAQALLPPTFLSSSRTQKVVTVAGTNGKGSTVATLAAILKAAGITFGSWTSPHLLRYNERISVNGEPVCDTRICHSFEAIEKVRKDVDLSYYEFGTLAALDIFCHSDVEVILLEVGLGGRLDTVNLLDADVAIVTTVSLDHQEVLGETVEEIAREKAGVFRANRPAICGEEHPASSLLSHIKDIGARALLHGIDFKLCKKDDLWTFTGRDGDGQLREIRQLPAARLPSVATACACQALLCIAPDLADNVFREGVSQAWLPGRCQCLTVRNAHGVEVRVVLDVAHNAQSAHYLAEQLEGYGGGDRVAVFGLLHDKDAQAVMAPLQGLFCHWHVATANYPLRATEGTVLADTVKSMGRSVDRFDTITDALRQALDRACHKQTVVVFGSFYVVAEALACLAHKGAGEAAAEPPG